MPATKRPASKRPAAKRPGGSTRAPVRVAATPEWWQRPWVIPAAVVTAIGLIVVVVLASRSGSSTGGGPGGANSSLAPASLSSTVTSVPASTFASVADGGVAQPFKKVSGQQPLTGANGKPVLLYMGADYCPYCAAERWSLVLALSRFGQIGGLQLTTSSSGDAFPDTNTFDFSHLSFTSDVLEVQAVEMQDRNGQTYQTPTPTQQSVFSALDQPPYSSTQGGIPFVDIGNRYVGGLPSSGYGPDALQGLTWDQIAQKLGNPNDSVTKGIVGNANRITAAICAVTNNQPSSVCQTPTIQQLVSQLPSS